MQKFLIFFLMLCVFSGCSTYFTKGEGMQISPQVLSQNSRVALLSSSDEKLKIAMRMTYLNDIDSSLFHNREYFFLEIFNDDEDVVLPDSMQISMFNRKPLWIRKVESSELDSILKLENSLAEGYLIAFRPVGPFEAKKIKVDMKIANFKDASFDFSYSILKTRL